MLPPIDFKPTALTIELKVSGDSKLIDPIRSGRSTLQGDATNVPCLFPLCASGIA